MTPQDTFDRIAADLIGIKAGHLWRGYGSAIFVEFGSLSPGRRRRDGSPGPPRGEFTLRIEWSWRIENSNSILCGSWSEEELWEPTFDLLRNAHVSGLSIFGRLPEIDLALTGGLHLVSLMTAEGQPSWSLTDQRSTPHIWLTVHDGALFESDGTVRGKPMPADATYDWRAFEIEQSGTSAGVCECCGMTTQRVWGFVRDEGPVGAFFISWTPGRPEHGAAFDLILGAWGDSAQASDRFATALMLHLVEGTPQFMVIDADQRKIAKSPLIETALKRSDVIGTALAPLVFAVVDAVYMSDSASEIRSWCGA